MKSKANLNSFSSSLNFYSKKTKESTGNWSDGNRGMNGYRKRKIQNTKKHSNRKTS